MSDFCADCCKEMSPEEIATEHYLCFDCSGEHQDDYFWRDEMTTENVFDVKMLKNKDRWLECIAANNDDYGIRAVQAAAHAMKLMDAGATMQDAEKVGFSGKGLSGYLAGCAASIVCECHERGSDFRAHWNTVWGAPDFNGVVNPALVQIKGRESE